VTALSRRIREEDGAAVIEFVFVAIVVMVPLVYLVLAASALQRNAFAVTQAAREAGRAFATAPDAGVGRVRAADAIELAAQDQGLSEGDTVLRFVTADSDCDGTQIEPTDEPGSEFRICVIRQFHLPGVPGFLAGANNRVTGTYLVHIDDFRAAQ
jgi:Flp pilus assembly protein TadG